MVKTTKTITCTTIFSLLFQHIYIFDSIILTLIHITLILVTHTFIILTLIHITLITPSLIHIHIRPTVLCRACGGVWGSAPSALCGARRRRREAAEGL